jgi:squalene-hopene/tetraprenyl-beta-curcumene cyclase
MRFLPYQHSSCFGLAGGLTALSLLSASFALQAEPRTAEASGVAEGNVSLANEVQHAIDKGTAWLEKHQDPKGFWSTGDQPALTALAVMALRGANGSEAALDTPAIKKGYEFILSCVQPDGAIYRKPELVTYNTALSMLALLAANRPEYTPIILKGRQYLVGLQTDFGEVGKVDDVFDGGVGYGSHYKHSDMSNTAQALEALYYTKQLAKDQNLAGARDLNWDAAIHFLQSCQNLPEYNKQEWVSTDPRDKGGFVYYPGQSMAGETNLPSGRKALRSYGSISYSGLLSYIYADMKRDDPRVLAVLNWLKQNYTLDENPGMGPQGLFYYFHTMSKALNLYGLDTIELQNGQKVNWREALALKLINLQQNDGSWVNANNRWWEKDPALVTSYAVISLEILKRKL